MNASMTARQQTQQATTARHRRRRRLRLAEDARASRMLWMVLLAAFALALTLSLLGGLDPTSATTST